MIILGYRDWSFKNDKGEEIAGTTLYCGHPLNNGVGHGFAEHTKFYCSARAFGDYEPTVGDDVKVYFNAKGKVAKVEPVL